MPTYFVAVTMSSAEKGEIAPPVSQSRSSSSDGEVGAVKESWATRNGFNLRSFTKKESGADIELERPMKTRHLHMISIGMAWSLFLLVLITLADTRQHTGGSIGAGFFVGSGGALAKGGPGSLLIDFAIIGIMMFNVGMLTQLISLWTFSMG